MCGIAGFSLLPGLIPPSEWVEGVCDVIRHRGPDSSGFVEFPGYSIGLAHTRLAIQDLSPSGHQPMSSSDGSLSIVFNGEIYNFLELRSRLEDDGYVFVGSSDTEVLLTLFKSLKRSNPQLPYSDLISLFLSGLNGIFAIALWDHDHKSLFLARDALGVKPLYVLRSHSGIYFASEFKGLPPTPLTLNYPSLDRYLTFLWNPGESTPSSCVSKLGPGQAMLIANGELQETIQWYRLPVFVLSLIHISEPTRPY